MFIAVRELELRKIRFELSYAEGQVDFFDSAVRQEGPLQVRGGAELAGPSDEIRVRGHLTGRLSCVCDRCLEPFALPIDGDFDLFYRPAEAEEGVAEERGISAEDTDVGFYEGDGIDLVDVVREQVLLWLPMQRSCQPDCKGICPHCGRNRNLEDCGCARQVVDERWSALKNIASGV